MEKHDGPKFFQKGGVDTCEGWSLCTCGPFLQKKQKNYRKKKHFIVTFWLYFSTLTNNLLRLALLGLLQASGFSRSQSAVKGAAWMATAWTIFYVHNCSMIREPVKFSVISVYFFDKTNTFSVKTKQHSQVMAILIIMKKTNNHRTHSPFAPFFG